MIPKNGTRQVAQTKTRIDKPKMYQVVMHNDDVTTMDFVVYVLCQVFFASVEKATQLMLTIHHEQSAVVGTYTYDIAVSKANKATRMARQEGFPLRITVMPVE